MGNRLSFQRCAHWQRFRQPESSSEENGVQTKRLTTIHYYFCALCAHSGQRWDFSPPLLVHKIAHFRTICDVQSITLFQKCGFFHVLLVVSWYCRPYVDFLTWGTKQLILTPTMVMWLFWPIWIGWLSWIIPTQVNAEVTGTYKSGKAKPFSGTRGLRSAPDIMLHCASCEKPILDRFLLKVLDRPWHIKCVQCCDCKCTLTEKCFSREGKLYCKNDFFR